MTIYISEQAHASIQAHTEGAYPEEAAGFLLGHEQGESRIIEKALPQANEFDADQRGRRYLIEPKDMLAVEKHADTHGYEILGIFHSHPDHPPAPSSFDLEWSLPWFSYLIISVQDGKAIESRCWRLNEDRSGFIEEAIVQPELTSNTVEESI